METINRIKKFIINNDIENAYEIIMQNENKYINNSEYWNLRGMLCSKIQEYDAAISCYKTSIGIKYDYLDAYFNLSYTYKLIGEKVKSALYGGIALRYTDDIDFINDITNLYKDEVLSKEYKLLLDEIKSNLAIDYNNPDLVKYIASKFKNIDKEYVELLSKNKIGDSWAYIKDNYVITSKEVLSINDFISCDEHSELNAIVLYDINYINLTREIALKGVKKCFIIVPTDNNKLELVEIDYKTMEGLRDKDYKRTVTLNRFNAADSNVYALIKYIPEKYKERYKLNIINGREVYNIENIVKVPLISSVTVSGFNTFVGYPKFTYNIDVGHGSVILKNCGIMDKKHKNFAFTPEEYENIDKVCISSNMNMLIQSAFSAIPEDKYEITGNPRTDTLVLSDGRKNLEKLLGRSIDGKKVIFNMPTFHIHENSGVINGGKFNDSIKIKGFNYTRFNEFLHKNNIICISKVHHAEERTIISKTKERKLENLLFISNENLDEKGLDLYEILNCADILITDYSSIYGDFLFMNKSTVFINADIEEYRQERGISLEPYDFWTAGPKVKTQDELELELFNCLYKEEYFKQKREELRDVFYKHKDSNSSLRVWNHIDKVLKYKSI
ncbi:CDP-glycerol glycerophosphotransferase family protein [[Clostridium] dakarense]|uniref:CDP-glycerol glycerophosphotransferase family protein n=1 Tax=Faecalimicrobium dakarense TaxID=1301100 RepID=UPI0004BBA1C8|nr:CDP-glycerol glycerophosphotransferase family protein [[Clostridium] dakarense]